MTRKIRAHTTHFYGCDCFDDKLMKERDELRELAGKLLCELQFIAKDMPHNHQLLGLIVQAKQLLGKEN